MRLDKLKWIKLTYSNNAECIINHILEHKKIMSLLFQGVTAENFVQVNNVHEKCVLLNKEYSCGIIFKGLP